MHEICCGGGEGYIQGAFQLNGKQPTVEAVADAGTKIERILHNVKVVQFSDACIQIQYIYPHVYTVSIYLIPLFNEFAPQDGVTVKTSLTELPYIFSC